MTTKPEYARQLTPWEIKQINGKSAPSSSSVDSTGGAVNFNVLSEREAQCYRLCRIAKLSLSEAANHLGISKGSVQMYLKRVTEKLGEGTKYDKYSKTPTISQAEVMERHNSQNNAQEYPTASPMHNIEHISPEHLNAINAALGDELDNRVDLDKLQRESDEETIAELMDEVAAADQRTEEARENARGWERKYYEELGRGDSWRTKCMDAERKIEKLKEEVGVETANRKYAEKLMDEALTTAYQDEQLAVALAAKFASVSKRNLEAN